MAKDVRGEQQHLHAHHKVEELVRQKQVSQFKGERRTLSFEKFTQRFFTPFRLWSFIPQDEVSGIVVAINFGGILFFGKPSS